VLNHTSIDQSGCRLSLAYNLRQLHPPPRRKHPAVQHRERKPSNLAHLQARPRERPQPFRFHSCKEEQSKEGARKEEGNQEEGNQEEGNQEEGNQEEGNQEEGNQEEGNQEEGCQKGHQESCQEAREEACKKGQEAREEVISER
jgi:hypothetical protein